MILASSPSARGWITRELPMTSTAKTIRVTSTLSRIDSRNVFSATPDTRSITTSSRPSRRAP